MWGVAKIFTSGHSKGGFDRTPRTPPGYGYEDYGNFMMRRFIVPYLKKGSQEVHVLLMILAGK